MLFFFSLENNPLFDYLGMTKLGMSTDHFPDRWIHYFLLCYKSRLYRNRAQCCQGWSYNSTPAQ